jgi:hypothetical protein
MLEIGLACRSCSEADRYQVIRTSVRSDPERSYYSGESEPVEGPDDSCSACLIRAWAIFR